MCSDTYRILQIIQGRKVLNDVVSDNAKVSNNEKQMLIFRSHYPFVPCLNLKFLININLATLINSL